MDVIVNQLEYVRDHTKTVTFMQKCFNKKFTFSQEMAKISTKLKVEFHENCNTYTAVFGGCCKNLALVTAP